MIKVNNISKSFVKSQVISNISATFEKGKTNLIIGQSGSGKTVLMKCLLGLYDVDNGEIFFDEKNMIRIIYQICQILENKLEWFFRVVLYLIQ